MQMEDTRIKWNLDTAQQCNTKFQEAIAEYFHIYNYASISSKDLEVEYNLICCIVNMTELIIRNWILVIN
jgi:hypothetical protein